ncbi:MAG: TIGR02679 domain-containing protein [Pseudomonadota bacterium]|nr:TIGR02679 domain-containing protein [Pseudomonadota bacterium]
MSTSLPIDRERLQRLLGEPEMRRLVDALRRRLERGVQGDLLQLPSPTDGERRAVDALLGRPPSRGKQLRVSLAGLEAVLRNAGAAPDLRSAIAALRGPLRNLPNEREQERKAWDAVLEQGRIPSERPGLVAWLEQLTTSGLLKRLSNRATQRVPPACFRTAFWCLNACRQRASR